MKLSLGLFVFLAVMLPLPVFGCPVNVSGNFVLNADLTCNENNGLVVTAAHTRIDLNGHTITCFGPGLNGSCQKIVDPVNPMGPGIPASSFVGILNNGHDDVHVFGAGTVDGFGIGVFMTGGLGMKVKG